MAPAKAVFAGETLHLMAGFAERPSGELRVAVSAPGQALQMQVVRLSQQDCNSDALARVAAMRRLPALALVSEAEATAIALNYQIASKYTSFVVVAQRNATDKASGMPATVKVGHMLAAGWGGSGSVMRGKSARLSMAVCMASAPAAPESLQCFDASPPALHFDPTEFARLLAEAVTRGESPPQSWQGLQAYGVTAEIIAELQSIAVQLNAAAQSVIDSFLTLALHGDGIDDVTRSTIAAVWKLRDNIWTRGRQRALRAAIRDRVLARLV